MGIQCYDTVIPTSRISGDFGTITLNGYHPEIFFRVFNSCRCETVLI